MYTYYNSYTISYYINTTLFNDFLYEDPNNTYTPTIILIPYHTI